MPLRASVVPSSDAVVGVLKRRRAREERREDALASWPMWRKRMHHVVRKDPWFERVIFVLIVLNCVSISLENLVDDGGVLETCEDIFTIIFFGEMIIKCVARGVIGEFGYFGSNANRFDFLLVVFSTYGLLQKWFFPSFDAIPAFTATAARSARLLRPLRTINILASLRIIVDSIFASATRLVHLLALAVFFTLTVGLGALQFFRGELQHRCGVPAANVTFPQVCESPTTMYDAPYELPAFNGFVCPWGQVCDHGAGNAEGSDTFFNFDSIIPTGMSIFSVLMLENWAAVMYRMADAVGLSSQLYFLLLVLVGAMFVLNLVLATVSDAFTSTLATLRDELAKEEPKQTAQSLAAWRLRFVLLLEKPVYRYAIAALTLVNVALLGCVYHGMPSDVESGITLATVVLGFLILGETVLKLLAKPPREFINDPLNPFDALLSVGSIIEFFTLGTASINALRSIRLLRLLEASKAMRRTLQTLGTAFGSAGSLLLLLVLLTFLFALLGMQLFAGTFCGFDDSPRTGVNTTVCNDVPRLNYDNVGYAFVTTFVFVVGDGWTDIMVNGLRARGEWALVFFVLNVLIGGLLMINLIIALLINATAATAEGTDDGDVIVAAEDGEGEDEDAVLIVIERPDASGDDVEMGLLRNQSSIAAPDTASKLHLGAAPPSPPPYEPPKPKKRTASAAAADTFDDINVEEEQIAGADDTLLAKQLDREELQRQAAVEASKHAIRRFCRVIVNSRAFNAFIVLTIVFSVAVMVVQSPLSPPDNATSRFLDWTDIGCAIVFVIEVLLKLVWLGPYNRDRRTYGKGYFQQRWNVFDFVMTGAAVGAAVLVLINEPWLLIIAKWLRLCRMLRPWSLVGRSRGTMLVFRALTGAMGAMTHLAIIATAVWAMYAILGTQIFRGSMYACTEHEWGDQSFEGQRITSRAACLTNNYTWENNVRNFDNVGESMMTLFGVATTDMWADVMFLNMDAVNFDEAPHTNNRPAMALFCITFVIAVTFLLLNMTVSVLIDSYNRTKKLVEESLRRSLLHQHKIDSLSGVQQDFVDMYRRCLVFIKPPLRPPFEPTSWRQRVRRVVRKRHYDFVYVAIAVVSVGIQGTAFAEMPPIYDELLVIIDAVFTGVFILFFLANVIGYGVREYMSTNTSKLELLINVVTAGAITARLILGPNDWVDLLRITRVLRLQRAFQVSTGLRLFLDTLLASWRTCVAVFLLLFLVFFMYANVGMRLFSAVKRGDGISRLANFERIDTALITLLRVATFDDWQVIMWDCAVKPPTCDPNIGECGWPGLAQFYFFTFIALGSWVGLNFFTAVLLDAFARSDREDRMAVQHEHLDHFRATWKRYTSSDLLPVPTLPLFLKKLGAPLGPKSGEESAESLAARLGGEEGLMSINNEVFQADVFDALLRHYYGDELPPRSEETLQRLLSHTFRRRRYRDTKFAQGWPASTIACVVRLQALWRAKVARRQAADVSQRLIGKSPTNADPATVTSSEPKTKPKPKPKPKARARGYSTRQRLMPCVEIGGEDPLDLLFGADVDSSARHRRPDATDDAKPKEASAASAKPALPRRKGSERDGDID